MILQSCQPVGTHCNLHLGKAHLHRPRVQQICSGTGSYKHLPKQCCTVRSVGAPGANPGTALPVTPSPRCSAHDLSLRSGRRLRSLGSCQGYVLREMGFRGVAGPLTDSQVWEEGCWRWRGVPEQRANTPLLRDGFSNFTERLLRAPDACSCSQFPCKLLPQAWCFQLVLGNIPLFTSSFFSLSPPFCVSLQGQGLNNLSPEIFAMWSLLTGRVYEEIYTQRKFFLLQTLTGKFLKQNQETEVETNNWKFKLWIFLVP